MGFHPEWNDIASWIKRSEQIFIKKLSRNDTSWADSARNGAASASVTSWASAHGIKDAV